MFASGGAGEQYLWEIVDLSDLPAIRRRWREERIQMSNYLKTLSEDDLERDIEYGTAQGSQPQTSKVWQILVHVVNHGTHHRSELSRYLHACGHPVGGLDFGSFVEQTRA